MDLFLGQLVYTSFPVMGFRNLASAQVPQSIRQAFMQGVVSRYWDSYNPPLSGYRAVYLYQVTPEQNLFGWLYNDGVDDMGRTHVPYFICYYLAEPLYPFHLANIFTCLQNGPIALIDRHKLPASLETTVLPELWSYQPARPGIAIPLALRQRSYITIEQGELLNLFVPVDEQEIVVKMNGLTYDQQAANFSIYTKYIIESIDTSAVELKDISQKAQPQEFVTQAHQSKDLTPVGSRNKALVVNAGDNRLSKTTALPKIISTLHFNIDRQQSAADNFALAYKNSQLLLLVGIAATVIALFGSIYGLIQTKSFAPSKLEFVQKVSANPASERKVQQSSSSPLARS